MARILVIDDEPQILQAVARALGRDDHDVETARLGGTGLDVAARTDPQIVIVDLGLPDLSGAEVIRRLRKRGSVPIIVLSGAGTEPIKVEALDAGADDYVMKPFGADELRARVRALLRRVQPPSEALTVRDFGTLCVDPDRQLVTRAGERVHLTPTEYALLDAFTSHPGKLLGHHWLLSEVWGRGYSEETRQYLRVYIGQLRAKLGDDAHHPRYIATEPGVGYRWIFEPEPSDEETGAADGE